MRKAEVDTEDRPDLAGDEEKDEDGSLFQNDDEKPDGEEEAADEAEGQANAAATENGGDVDTGYGFYRRMGEIG
jgi:protein involved in temperature-dependent protein secretion